LPCEVTKVSKGRVSVSTPEGVELTFYLDPKTKKPSLLSRINHFGGSTWVEGGSFSEAVRMAAGIFRDPRKAEALRNS